MDAERINSLLVFLFSFGLFTLPYVFIVIIPLIKIVSKRKRIAFLGEPLDINNKNKLTSIQNIGVIYSIVFLAISIYLLTKDDIIGTIITFCISFGVLLSVFAAKKYRKENGIYEHGLLIGTTAYPWTYIYSWKIIKTDTIQFLMENGFRKDYAPINFSKAMEKVKDEIQEETS